MLSAQGPANAYLQGAATKASHLPQLLPQRRQVTIARKLSGVHAQAVALPPARPHLVLQILVLLQPPLQGLRGVVACVNCVRSLIMVTISTW